MLGSGLTPGHDVLLLPVVVKNQMLSCIMYLPVVCSSPMIQLELDVVAHELSTESESYLKLRPLSGTDPTLT
jgi:hypothetical protein